MWWTLWMMAATSACQKPMQSSAWPMPTSARCLFVCLFVCVAWMMVVFELRPSPLSPPPFLPPAPAPLEVCSCPA
jgi:hypothetical protein